MDQALVENMQFTKFTPLVKMDEKTHTVYGLVTAESPDKEGEIADYGDTKKQYEAWSLAKYSSTKAAGQEVSYGNVRLQHTLEMGGKVAKPITYDDDAKEILVNTTPKNDEIWNDLKRGFYTGFSHGGDYLYRRCNDCGTDIPVAKGRFCSSCKKQVYVRYAPILAEISYVDNSCHPEANFEYVKADGSSELRKFTKQGATAMDEKPVLSDDMIAQINATVIKAMGESTPQLVESFAAAMRKASKTPEQEQREKKDALKAVIGRVNKIQAWLAKRLDPIVTQLIKTINGESELQKGMYEVAEFCRVLSSVSYLQYATECEAAYEGDDSDLPEKLQADLAALAETFLEMAEEEVSELVSASAERKAAKMLKVNAGALAKAGSDSLAKAAKSAVEHVATIKKAMTDHADKMCKLHKDHCDAMHEKVGKLAKILGAEEAQEDGDNDPDPIDPQSEGTENTQKGMTAEAVQKAIAEAVTAAVVKAQEAATEQQFELLKAVIGEDAVEALLAKADGKDKEDDADEDDGKKAKKAAAVERGVGERTPTVLAGAGAVVKVMPTTKTQDTPANPAAAAPEVTTDVTKAALGGDTASALALMKSARPQTNVPVTVAAALGNVKR